MVFQSNIFQRKTSERLHWSECCIFEEVLNNLEGLTTTWYSEKIISTRCTCDFMPNSNKKYWMVSLVHISQGIGNRSLINREFELIARLWRSQARARVTCRWLWLDVYKVKGLWIYLDGIFLCLELRLLHIIHFNYCDDIPAKK